MASNLYRMLNSFAIGCTQAVGPAHIQLPIHRARHRSRKNPASHAAIFGIFCERRNRTKPGASPIVEPP
jgi:hypothetical protein